MHYLIAVILFLASQPAFSEPPDFKFSFNINNGLSDNRVYSIVQDERGFAWIGTHNGLNRFDGHQFKVFNSNNSVLSGNTIWQIKKGPPHHFVMGTSHGVVILDTRTGVMKKILVPSIPELTIYANNIRHIEYTNNKEIILGTQNGIYVMDWNGKILTRLEADFDLQDLGIKRLNFSSGITAFSNGNALLLTSSGYCYYDSESKNILKVNNLPQTFQLLKDFLSAHQESYIFEINRKDQLFFIDHRSAIDSVYIVDFHKQKISAQPLPFVVKNNIRWDSKVQFHSDSLLTITTAREGFFTFMYNSDDIRLQLKSGNNGAHVFCQYVMLDADYNYWLGTETGIYYENDKRRSVKNISILPYVESSGYHPVTAVSVHHNKIWIGGYSGTSGLIVLNKKFQVLKRIDLFKNSIDKNFIISIFPWSADTLLVGTKFGAFFVDCRTYTSSPFSIQFSNDVYSAITIQNYFHTTSGEIWLSGGQTGGVWKINKSRDSLQHYKPGKKAADFTMRSAGAFAEDKNGNIWMVHWVDGLTRWNKQQGVFDTLIRRWPGNELSRFDCSGIVIDSTDNFWLFINAYGLVKFDLETNTIHRVVTTNDQADDNVSSLLLTGDSLIWMNLRHSILVYKIKTSGLASLSSKNGLPPEANSSQNLIYDHDAKTTLAGFTNYISVIPVHAIAGNDHKRKVFIIGVQVLKTNQAIDFTVPVILSNHKNDLRIDYSVPDYVYNLPHSDFEYRLDPSDPWINIGSASSLNLNNLRFGHYTVQIRQAGMNQYDPDLMATLDIKINPAYYQTFWFYLILAVIVILISYTIYRYQALQSKEVLSVKEKIASDLHDDIGSRLTNIRMLSEIGEDDNIPSDEKKKYLKRISDEALASGEALDEIVHHMHTSDEELDDFAARMRRYAGELFDNGKTELTIKMADFVRSKELGIEQKRDLFLAFKEVLNNINKHASASKVHIELKADRDNLFLVVSDNGKGFVTKENGERNGLRNIQSRIGKWKGDVTIDSKSGAGTTVFIRLPFKWLSHIKRIFTRKVYP